MLLPKQFRLPASSIEQLSGWVGFSTQHTPKSSSKGVSTHSSRDSNPFRHGTAGSYTPAAGHPCLPPTGLQMIDAHLMLSQAHGTHKAVRVEVGGRGAVGLRSGTSPRQERMSEGCCGLSEV